MNEQKKSIFSNHEIMCRALKDSFIKLNPRTQIKNPVMFMVFVSAILTFVMFLFSLAGIRDAAPGYILAISVILWFTVLFGNFAEAIAEGRERPRQMPCVQAERIPWHPGFLRLTARARPSG